MIGLVYKDTVLGVLTDKICTNVNGVYGADIPANLHTASYILNMEVASGMYMFKTPFYGSRQYNLFRLVNIVITPNDDFTFSETQTSVNDKVVYVSNDNLNIVAYRSGSYQVVTVASLLASEVPIIGELSFTDMQDLMTAAATLTSPQTKYMRIIANNTISFTEL